MLFGMAYTSTSASDRLAWVRQAIDKVLSGCQEYYVGSRRVRYPSLAELMKLEQSLMQQEAAASAGGMAIQVGVKVPAS